MFCKRFIFKEKLSIAQYWVCCTIFSIAYENNVYVFNFMIIFYFLF